MKIFKFPEIGQFRNAIQFVQHRGRYVGDDENGDSIYDTEKRLPILNFRGSVKLHGTNAGIIFDSELAKPYFQSREMIITPENDNMGFARYMSKIDLAGLRTLIGAEEAQIIKVYGEWCGEGIMKGVAINKLEKMFVIFALKIDDEWVTDDILRGIKIPDLKIYNMLDYPTYEIDIDFNRPKLAQDRLGAFVEEVESQCPVAKAFEAEGIGEGIVWVCTDPEWSTSKIWFKTKGEKHNSTKTKEKVPVDVEKVKSIKEFVDNVLTESRLQQGIDFIKSEKLELERKNLGSFLKWINVDVIKEESDTLDENGLIPKDINSALSKKAREWFFKKEEDLIGL